MASEKQRRFRTHVVKELFETEKDYTIALEFTVTSILERAREKGGHDNTFTEEDIKTLFCNIEEILEFHKRLMSDLSACIGSKGPSYDTEIARCFLNHRESFDLYRVYGEKNEYAQKRLYDLKEDHAMEAFFIGCMLLGGKGNDDISSYIFKPIQRICKYPLLFRELIKYTPTDHKDYEATKEALDMMRSICSVINEAKRQVEKLEKIADWQATVDNWEGSNITDTCNELITEGPLVKISAGNTQERQFFLFNNLLVYCKKANLLGAKTRAWLFRGRIPVESLNIEDIVDGTSDYYTNGIAVTNSWKVHNIAKNKWFVLIAKTYEQKQYWMDCIRRVKEQRKREQAGRASSTRNVILNEGEKIYNQATDDHLPKDHKAKLKSVPKSFTGREFIKWLQVRKRVETVEQGVILGQALLENGVLHHVADRHQFKNSEYLYRFRYDDNTFRGKSETADLSARGIRIYCRLHSMFDPLVKDHRAGLRTMPCVVMSQKLLDWWTAEKDVSRRVDGVVLGEQFFATGILRHITDEQNFKDGQVFYRFTADDGHEGSKDRERKGTQSSVQLDFTTIRVLTCRIITFPYSEEQKGYGVELSNTNPVTIKSLTSQAQTLGVCMGDHVLAINGHFITPNNPTEHHWELTIPQSKTTPPPPLHLTVEKTKSMNCSLVPTTTGLGFHIRGSSPVVISDVDKDSAASQAGFTIGSCVLKVGEKDMVTCKHDEVVAEVKKSLDTTARTAGGKRVSVKLSLPSMEHMAQFQYENIDSIALDVYERTVESPYVFSVPAQLLKLYSAELVHLNRLLSGTGIKDEKVTKYLEDIKNIAGLYIKTKNMLSQPRWPSYKLHGTAQSKFLEASPTNLHTSIMGVVQTPDSFSHSPTRGSVTSTLQSSELVSRSPSRKSVSLSECEEDTLPTFTNHTSYCISTMQIPSVEDSSSICKEDSVCLENVQTRREMLHNMVERVREMTNDYEAIKKMIPEMKQVSTHPLPNGGSSLGIPDNMTDDLTPVGSPTNSPILPHRSRVVSMSNPEPVIRLVAEELIRRGQAMEEMLEDQSLISILKDTDGIIEPSYQDLLTRFKERLKVLSGELKVCAKRPGENLIKSAKIFIDTIQKHMEELSIHIWTSLILCDKIRLLEGVDKLFSQTLTCIVTAFSQQLLLAVRGQLNTAVEYGDTNANSSKQWLQMVGKKGVLVHFEGTMLPKERLELSALQGFSLVLSQMERVTFILEPATDSSPPPLPGSELPPVTLEGGHDMLRVIFHLPPFLYRTLPEDVMSGNGIKIHTVLFNKGLADLEEGRSAYAQEKALNSKGLKSLEAYYKQMRAFRLDKSNLPSDSDEMTLAINKISIPLNAMDFLMRQLRTAVLEPMRPGVGLLTLAAELTTRMGALRVNFCNSGVYRSGLTSSLEQVMVLGRCHGLPFKNFRSTLNIMRRRGHLVELIAKNQANMKKSLPERLKLYNLPPDPQEENRVLN